jgi:SAM-dependent methyltransferase
MVQSCNPSPNDMFDYYDDRLSAERLRRAYEIAPPRVKQYLEAEIDHVESKIRPGDLVLELGCGYGRVLERLAKKAERIVGIDTSLSSLLLAHDVLSGFENCLLVGADAIHLPFPSGTFNVVACIQNGISAFHVDHRKLISEAVRVTKTDGIVLFSSYSDKFWVHRLDWFRLQSEAGLLGELDEEKTGNGVIVCKDGFTGTIVRPGHFRELTSGLHAEVQIVEVDSSSVFCEITPIE